MSDNAANWIEALTSFHSAEKERPRPDNSITVMPFLREREEQYDAKGCREDFKNDVEFIVEDETSPYDQMSTSKNRLIAEGYWIVQIHTADEGLIDIQL